MKFVKGPYCVRCDLPDYVDLIYGHAIVGPDDAVIAVVDARYRELSLPTARRMAASDKMYELLQTLASVIANEDTDYWARYLEEIETLINRIDEGETG